MKKGEEETAAGWKVQEVIILIGKLTFFLEIKKENEKKTARFFFFLFLVSLNEEHRRIINLYGVYVSIKENLCNFPNP